MLEIYQPVFILPFRRKTRKKFVATRLARHLNTRMLYNDHQYAYRTGHFTDAAFLNVHREIAKALANKCTAALVLLDWK